MKKIFTIALATSLLLVLAACKPVEEEQNELPVLAGIESSVTVNVGDTWDPLDGVTASDEEDGDLTSQITVDNLDCLALESGNVVPESAGGASCTLTYKVEDSDGGKAQRNSTVTVEVVVDVTENALINGDFALGGNGWTNPDSSLIDLYNDAVGTGEVVDGVLVITVTVPSWDTSAPRVNQEGIAYENGKTYEVSFDAKANVADLVMKSQVGVLLSSDPWFTPYFFNPEGGAYEFTLGTEFETFSYKFTVTEATTDNGTVTFEFGGNVAGEADFMFYLDNVVVKESTPDADEDAPVLGGLDEATLTLLDTFDALDGVTISDFDTTLTTADLVITHDGGTDVTDNMDGTYAFVADGVYTFTYEVTDASGNTASETRTVNVVGDAEAPVLSGLDNAYVVGGFAWNPLDGVSFTDLDETLTMDDFVVVVKDSTDAAVTADANGLYTLANGVYSVLYTLVDSTGNAANGQRYISVVDAPVVTNNQVLESDFTGALAAWGTWFADWDGTAVTFDNSSDAMVVDVTSVGGETWSVQLFQENTINLVAGKTYAITFEASATVDRDILIELIDGNNQWSASLKDTTQRFVFTYTAAADVTGAKLNFLLGNVNGAGAGAITLDNVMVYEVAPDMTNIVAEADFTGALTAWGTWFADWDGTAVTFDNSSDAMVVDVTNVGGETWSVQLFQEGINMTAGTFYMITFEASATVDRDIFFEVIDGNNQFAASLTSATQTFTYMFFNMNDNANVKINFLLGNVNGAGAGAITIDNVVIYAVTPK